MAAKQNVTASLPAVGDWITTIFVRKCIPQFSTQPIEMICTSMMIVCGQRHKGEAQADHKDRRKNQVWAERRRHRQAWTAVAFLRQEKPTQRQMGRDETVLGISGASRLQFSQAHQLHFIYWITKWSPQLFPFL